MTDLSIPAIRERLFNTSKHEQTTSRNSSNPFAKTSFKGNVLTADVFESSKNKVSEPSFTGKLGAIPAKSKLYMSTIVGSINNFGNRISQKFHAGIESINNFCNRVSDSVSGMWNTLKTTEVKLDFVDNFKDALTPGIRKSHIAKIDLSNDELYKSTRELFSGKVAEWTNSAA